MNLTKNKKKRFKLQTFVGTTHIQLNNEKTTINRFYYLAYFPEKILINLGCPVLSYPGQTTKTNVVD